MNCLAFLRRWDDAAIVIDASKSLRPTDKSLASQYVFGHMSQHICNGMLLWGRSRCTAFQSQRKPDRRAATLQRTAVQPKCQPRAPTDSVHCADRIGFVVHGIPRRGVQ